ncbi:MAG TPA: BREX system P-loop protein BrxC [Syntrophales bacterium]|nr:BREX system P-loop protein BrxC [Syntrophales bacterium]
MKNFRQTEDFVINYPFAPYHFQLLQKVFESIRKAGATGKHLAMGERSMLDAFQSAAKNISAQKIGALVPLYEFYPAIESFLDTIVRRTIDQAKENAGLEPFDVQLLRILFLIRYVDIVKSNADNLTTLCIEEVDADRLALKRQIEDALQRLEKQTLISRNGDLFFYLTDEERSISREIKNTDFAGGEVTKVLSEFIFQDVFKDDNKCRYHVNKKDYGYNRLCDGQPHGRVDQELGVEVITPIHDEFTYFVPQKCIMHSTTDGGRVLIRLPDQPEFGRELQTYVQTAKYIRLKNDAAAPESLKKILSDRAYENRERKTRLTTMLEKMVVEGDYYACGQTLKQKSTTPKIALYDSVSYMIANIYTKLGYLNALQEEPQKEIRAVLLANDIGQYTLQLDGAEGNAQALKEMKQFIDLSMAKNHSILLSDLVDRFSGRPYGWPEFEIVLLMAKLFVAGEIKVMVEGEAVLPKDAIEPLTKSVRWKQVKILKRKAVGAEELAVSCKLGQELFGKIGPDSEDGLNAFLRGHLMEWEQALNGYKPLADMDNYPGKKEIDAGSLQIDKIIAIADSYEFFQAFNGKREDLIALSEDVHELKDFYTNQRTTWEKLQKAVESYKPNRQELEKDTAAAQALARMDEILSAKRPYGMIKEVDGLLERVKKVNDRILEKRKESSIQTIDDKIGKVMEALDQYKADSDLRNKSLKPLQDIKKHVQQEHSIPGIFYQANMAEEALEKALEHVESAKVKEGDKTSAKPVKYIQPSKVTVKNYLETAADIEEFLEALKKELETALREHARIRIQ